MAYVRRLPSGRWQATVRHPSGRRLTKTDPLRRIVADWARDVEAQLARGEVRDPRAGRVTVGEWYERWFAARVAAPNSLARTGSVWRVHLEPKWAGWPMQAVTRMEAQQWVRELERTRRAHHGGRRLTDDDDDVLAPGTIAGIVVVMTSLFNAALAESPALVSANPFARLALPELPPGRVVWYSRDEHEAILAAMRNLGVAARWQVMADLGAYCGLRYGEMVGLPGSNVGWLRGELNVWRQWTVHGIRDIPKTRRSHRTVPVPARVMEGMSRLMRDRDPAALVFAGPGGGWHSAWHREWYRAVAAAAVPAHPPHVLRHTAASWLVMEGVDLRRVQALLGHERYATTERYAHLAPDAHDRIRKAWKDRDARTTHEAKVTRLSRTRKAR